MRKNILFILFASTSILVSAQINNSSKLGVGGATPVGPGYFNDVTTAAGFGTIGFTSTSWGDVNNDGHLDALVAGNLYLNNQNGTFTNITSSAGLTAPYYVSTFIDMNNDGKEDILYLSKTPSNNYIYINNGNNTFTPVSLNLTTPAFVFISTLSVADVNNDKYPDLFVGQLRDENNGGAPLKNYFYLNNKNNGFTFKDLYPANMGSSSAVPDSTKWETRASCFNDYDMDGDMDLYVAIYRQEQDQLWQNDGNGNFKNVLRSTNNYLDYIPNPVDWSDHGTGCDWADYDNDGDQDLLLSNFAHPTNYYTYGFGTTAIWRNDGHTATTFTKLTPAQSGIQYTEPYAGAAWGDINADGLPEVYITCFAWYASCNYSFLYQHNSNHTFTDISGTWGMNIAKGEADGSFVDYNNDGKLDLASAKASFNFVLFKNEYNSGNNWLELDLRSTTGNYFGIGAKVEVVAGGVTYTQYQTPNHGALQCKGNRMYFGLGTASAITSVKVTWPNASHTQETFTGMNVNGIYTLNEGSGVALGVLNTTAKDVETKLFPNPNNGTFTIALNAQSEVTVINVLGEVVYSEVLTLGVHTLETLVKTKGVYFVKVQQGDKLETIKMTVE